MMGKNKIKRLYTKTNPLYQKDCSVCFHKYVNSVQEYKEADKK